MSRPARSLTVTPEGGFFHVFNRVAGPVRFFPFRRPRVRRKFMSWLGYCLNSSCLKCASFTLMDNHFHLIVKVDKFRRLARKELQAFARARWGVLWKLRTEFWSDRRWRRFNRDLFRLDVFMRDFQGPLTTWFNRTFKRRGPLWQSRYKSVHLADSQAVAECLFYIELNPVRAGLTKRPEDWKRGSAFLRYSDQDEMLMALGEIFKDVPKAQAYAHYRACLLHRGDRDALDQVEAKREPGLSRRGLYLTRLGFFTNGLVLGSADRVRQVLERFLQTGAYCSRRHPIPHLDGLFLTLREQRSHGP